MKLFSVAVAPLCIYISDCVTSGGDDQRHCQKVRVMTQVYIALCGGRWGGGRLKTVTDYPPDMLPAHIYCAHALQ